MSHFVEPLNKANSFIKEEEKNRPNLDYLIQVNNENEPISQNLAENQKPKLEEYRAASIKTNIQEELQSLWKAGLGLEEVGLNEDFFELGGNSLKILPIIAKIKKKVAGVKVQDFFKYRTIADMTGHLLRTANTDNYSLAVETMVSPDSKKLSNIHPQYRMRRKLYF